jgi:phosphoribosylanthranilate isomerase
MKTKLKTRIKICGMRSREEIELAALYGADAVGFITEIPFVSPRRLDSETAASLISEVPGCLDSVLVIMPDNSVKALDLIEKVRPDIVQIHSTISIPELEKVRENADIPIIKVLSIPVQEKSEKAQGINSKKNAVEDAENSILFLKLLEQVNRLEETDTVDSILLDTGKTGKPGGTGCVHDWTLSRRIAQETRLPLILAGGLKPENVQEAIRTVLPYAVDTASGVETFGKKDALKIKSFIEEVRCANAFL